ncbi:MAG: uroporphyrinogen-III synthase [Egibacteraceae bacterium]
MQGLRIGVTSARKGGELTEALERRGAVVAWGPTVATVPPASDAELLAATDAILTVQPEWLAASTGAGMKAWVEAADTNRRGEALRGLLVTAKVVARGAKAAGALRAMGAVPVYVAAQETDADLSAWLAKRVQSGEAVAVQVHSDDDGRAYSELDRRRIRVIRVSSYRCVLPEDRTPAIRLINDILAGDIDVVVATSAPAARHLLMIAAEMGQRAELERALRERVAVAAVGPVTATAFEQDGIGVSIMPERFRTGDLIRALGGWAQRRDWANGACKPLTGPIALVPDDQAARVDGADIPLGDREFALLAALVRRPHIVCRMSLLARETWGASAVEDHTHVKHLIFRLRRKLGPAAATLQSVRGVGYRYNPTP